MAKPKTKADYVDEVTELRRRLAECEVQRDHLENVQSSSTWGAIGTAAIRWFGIVGVMYFVFSSVAVLAGKDTNASIFVGIITSLAQSKSKMSALCAVIAGLAILWGSVERALRLRNIQRLGDRVAKLERRTDSHRQSSLLTPSGTTHPGDRP